MDKAIWLKKPEKHDYEAAYNYLTLLFEPDIAKKYVDQLKDADIYVRKSKDILRASRLPNLPRSNVHVKDNILKLKKGEKLSPVLLVRKDDGLIIADGYHRVCTIYYMSEDFEIPCKLI